jgi:Mn-dependent DtxR family transcriptional regulator
MRKPAPGMPGSSGEESFKRRLAREDVLRYLREMGGEASLEDVLEEVGDRTEAGRAIRDLKEEGLIEETEEGLRLTRRGEEKAREILERHMIAEKILEEAGLLHGGEAHKAAHSLEHLSLDVARIIREARGKRVEPLYNLERGETGRVLAVLEASPSILARLYGVGILPGKTVKILTKSRGLVIVETGAEARLAAIDSRIARKVLVVRVQ